MKLTTAFASLLVTTTLAITGCQGGEESLDRETTEQDLSAEQAPTERAEFVRKHHDPAQMFAKLDKDGDGRVLISELEGRHAKHLAKADLDNDGVLTLSELQAAHAKRGEEMKAHHEEMFAKADKNSDGKLAESEVPAPMWQHLKSADADGDGLLSKAELQAAHESGKLRPPQGMHGMHGKHGAPSPEKMIERFDTNKDGKLSLSELPEHMRERMQDADKNADGVLESAELTTHFSEMKARFAAEHPDFAEKMKARFDGERPDFAGKMKMRRGE